MTARLDWSRLHSKILRSSVWSEEPMVRLVWICALADSDTAGTFFGDEATLARAWNLPVDAVTAALGRLGEPDPKSATKEHEGRRIERVGQNEWLVLNKTRYNPSGEPAGASTARVQRFRDRKRLGETGETGNARNDLEERRGEEREKREGVAPSALALPLPSVGPEFPVAGSREPWTCPADFAAELVKLYPNVPILGELEKAAVKIKRGAVAKKTPKGMTKFLMSWMERCQNSARPTAVPEPEKRNFLKPGESPSYTGDHRKVGA